MAESQDLFGGKNPFAPRKQEVSSEEEEEEEVVVSEETEDATEVAQPEVLVLELALEEEKYLIDGKDIILIDPINNRKLNEKDLSDQQLFGMEKVKICTHKDVIIVFPLSKHKEDSGKNQIQEHVEYNKNIKHKVEDKFMLTRQIDIVSSRRSCGVRASDIYQKYKFNF